MDWRLLLPAVALCDDFWLVDSVKPKRPRQILYKSNWIGLVNVVHLCVGDWNIWTCLHGNIFPGKHINLSNIWPAVPFCQLTSGGGSAETLQATTRRGCCSRGWCCRLADLTSTSGASAIGQHINIVSTSVNFCQVRECGKSSNICLVPLLHWQHWHKKVFRKSPLSRDQNWYATMLIETAVKWKQRQETLSYCPL